MLISIYSRFFPNFGTILFSSCLILLVCISISFLFFFIFVKFYDFVFFFALFILVDMGFSLEIDRNFLGFDLDDAVWANLGFPFLMSSRTLRRRLHHGDVDGGRNDRYETSGFDSLNEPLLGDRDHDYTKHSEVRVLFCNIRFQSKLTTWIDFLLDFDILVGIFFMKGASTCGYFGWTTE